MAFVSGDFGRTDVRRVLAIPDAPTPLNASRMRPSRAKRHSQSWNVPWFSVEHSSAGLVVLGRTQGWFDLDREVDRARAAVDGDEQVAFAALAIAGL